MASKGPISLPKPGITPQTPSPAPIKTSGVTGKSSA